MSAETTPNSTERTWSYTTPYDLIDRAKIIANEGENGTRAVAMDNYIHYINNDMPEDYLASTQMDADPYDDEFYPVDPDSEYEDFEREAILLYKPDEEGKFVPFASTDTYGEFLGDMVVIEGDDVLVVNTKIEMGKDKVKMSLGVVAHKYVKLINTMPNGPDEDPSGVAIYFKRRLGGILYELEYGKDRF